MGLGFVQCYSHLALPVAPVCCICCVRFSSLPCFRPLLLGQLLSPPLLLLLHPLCCLGFACLPAFPPKPPAGGGSGSAVTHYGSFPSLLLDPLIEHILDAVASKQDLAGGLVQPGAFMSSSGRSWLARGVHV